MICPTCKHYYQDPIQIRAIMELGECFSCDHSRADTINVGDNEHTVEIPITEETTTPKGETIL